MSIWLESKPHFQKKIAYRSRVSNIETSKHSKNNVFEEPIVLTVMRYACVGSSFQETQECLAFARPFIPQNGNSLSHRRPATPVFFEHCSQTKAYRVRVSTIGSSKSLFLLCVIFSMLLTLDRYAFFFWKCGPLSRHMLIFNGQLRGHSGRFKK